jgi:hypothetical protein
LILLIFNRQWYFSVFPMTAFVCWNLMQLGDSSEHPSMLLIASASLRRDFDT